jgi:predicted YcjX-like family ATPase
LQKQSKLIDCLDALNWYRNDFTQLKYQLKKLMKNF